MFYKKLVVLLLVIAGSVCASGKIDFGPCWVDMQVLEHGKTKEHIEMTGGRLDATIQLFPGDNPLQSLIAKPSLTWAEGDGNFLSTGISLGIYTPITNKFTVTPVAGVTYNKLSTKVDYYGFKLKQITSATTPFIGVDLCYCLNYQWVLSGSFQYGWAAGRTYIDGLFGKNLFSKGESCGPTCSVMLDYYVTPEWSINAAWAYNYSLTKEKYGYKVKGLRLGLGYTY